MLRNSSLQQRPESRSLDTMNTHEKIAKLEEEKADLEIMLEAVTGHSDGMAEELLHKVRKLVETSEKRFRLITETIPVPVLVTQESDGVIIFANHYAADLFKVPVSSLLGRKIQEFYNPAERQKILEHVRTQGGVKKHEIQGKKTDDTPFQAELTVQSFHYNEKACLLSVWYDITEQRILEARLLQNQKMEAMGTLAGGIAHDFNNILTAIFGYTELSLNLLPPESRVRKNLDSIFQSAVRAKEMVAQILSFCRHSEKVMKPIHISLIIKEAMKLLRQIIPSHIQINTVIKNSETIIVGDPSQIHQVLMNLCCNAADAIRQTGGCMDILLEEVGPDQLGKLLIPELQPGIAYVRLSVRDNGPGMSKRTVDRIFDPFFTTKQPGKGTGMGLSVVHGIIKNHGGAICVESEPENGTIFHVYFPIAQQVEDQENPGSEDQISGGRGNILLVDDEKNILKAYEEILKSLGYKADTRHVSQEALELFRQNPDLYDLLITDYAMPDMTGNCLAREIFRIRPDIPIILCSGYHDPVIREKARQAGVRDFLTKPFTRNELAAILQKYLKAKS